MRMTFLVGLIMIAIGMTALYQTKNGFFMYLVGHGTYWPPADAAAVQAEFDALGEVRTAVKNVRLADAAAVQAACLGQLSGQTLSSTAAQAFERFNLVLLGAGQNVLSPVIAPDVRRLPELRRDLTQPDRLYQAPDLRASSQEMLQNITDDLSAPENVIYAGLNLTGSFDHLDLRNHVRAFLTAGEDLHRCVSKS